ncbi:hypothetical protein ZOSMA_324G00100 [Zostera marina]|uniref:Uncharacterized protein n=1 Tax=Zostera marina TaxID=29655 RepID=A0A0K9P8L2_ZOSMR|nr:hypothetical protein ZOSMA_324G00100 [Zostera marina]
MEGSGDGGFRSTMNRFLYSGEKKHVFVGFVIFGIVFGGPWFYMTRGGQKQQSHEDYMEKADRARNERLGH